MSRIEELREVTDQTLHGLTADDSLKFRILQKAAGGEETKKPYFKPVPVFCAACAVLLVMVMALNSLKPVSNTPGEINVFAAGSTEKPADMEQAGLLPAGFEAGSVVSVELDGVGSVTDLEKCASLAGMLDGRILVAGAGGGQDAGGDLQDAEPDGDEHLFRITGADLLVNGSEDLCRGKLMHGYVMDEG